MYMFICINSYPEDDNVLKVPDFALLNVVSLHVDAKHYKFNSAVSGRMTRNNLLVSPTLHRGAGKKSSAGKIKWCCISQSVNLSKP